MHVPKSESTEFAKKYFYPETIMNYVQIFHEISKLAKIRGAQHVVLTLIEQREAYILRLRQISQQMSTNKRTSNYEKTLLSDEVPDIIQNIREVTIKIILAIMKWREKLPRKQTFYYNSLNYVMKMRNDLDFLKMTALGPFMEKAFPLESNPLLLPMSHINERFASSTTSSNLGSSQHRMSKMMISAASSRSLKQNMHAASSNNISNNIAAAVSFEPNKNHSHKNQLLVKLLEDKGSKFIEDCVRVDRVIFVGEDKFQNEIRDLEIKERAATKIQCFTRAYMARKIARQLRKERNPKIKKEQQTTQPVTESTTVSENKQTFEEEENELLTRLEAKSNGEMAGCEGRFNRKIFNRRDDHLQLV